MVIQAARERLVMATHGRGIWIIDDITPLRQITAATLEQDVTLLESRPAVLRIPRGQAAFPGDTYFAAGNPWTVGADRLLPEKAAHVRRDEDRDLRPRRAN